MFGIFGHGNVAGMGEALQQAGERLRYYPARNEQAMVHTAAAYAKMANRLRDVRLHQLDRTRRDEHAHGRGRARPSTACRSCSSPATSSPRVRSRPCCSSSSPRTQDVSVNDASSPVSRYWDRINRPEQLVDARCPRRCAC